MQPGLLLAAVPQAVAVGVLHAVADPVAVGVGLARVGRGGLLELVAQPVAIGVLAVVGEAVAVGVPPGRARPGLVDLERVRQPVAVAVARDRHRARGGRDREQEQGGQPGAQRAASRSSARHDLVPPPRMGGWARPSHGSDQVCR
jgi:hypothetical protein